MEQTTRRRFLKRTGVGVFGASMLARGIRAAETAADGQAAAPRPPAGKPNILFIMTDQQSATMLSCAGNKWLKTPAWTRS